MVKILPILLMLLLPFGAGALSCAERDAADVLAENEQIFVGVARSITPQRRTGRRSYCYGYSKKRPECGAKAVWFDVNERLKGEIGDRVLVHVRDGCSCLGAQIESGKEYLVVIDPLRRSVPWDRLVARSVCWGTGEVTSEFTKRIIDLVRSSSG